MSISKFNLVALMNKFVLSSSQSLKTCFFLQYCLSQMISVVLVLEIRNSTFDQSFCLCNLGQRHQLQAAFCFSFLHTVYTALSMSLRDSWEKKQFSIIFETILNIYKLVVVNRKILVNIFQKLGDLLYFFLKVAELFLPSNIYILNKVLSKSYKAVYSFNNSSSGLGGFKICAKCYSS